MPRTTRILAAVAGAIVAGAVPATAAAADPSTPAPSASTVIVATAGTSFLTAAPVGIGQPVKLGASTGDYLYWRFDATAGQVTEIALTVTLPAVATRHGGSTWTVDVFDGLRRRQACTAGAQAPAAGATDTEVRLGCTLREVRSWAEPWSGDPLPGTYYVRLSVIDLAEPDLGLPIGVGMVISASNDGDAEPEGGDLAVPLVPQARPGAAPAATGGPTPTVSPSGQALVAQGQSWLAASPARWIWTSAGGVLAGMAGVVGFRVTVRPRRRRAAPPR